MKRRARARRRRRVDQVVDQVETPPALSGMRFRVSVIDKLGGRHCRIDLDMTELLLLQQYRRQSMRLGDIEIEISRTAT